MTKAVPLFAALLLTAGCAATTPLVVGRDHPANPAAPEAPAPPASATLVDALPLNGAPPTETAAQPGSNPHAEHAHGATTTSTTTSAAIVYTCPHHPEVVSESAGKCPKCHMTLVRREAGE